MSSRVLPRLSRLTGAAAAALLAAGLLSAPSGAGPDRSAATADAAAGEPAYALVSATPKQPRKKKQSIVTPGDFTGYGFDQCLAPTQQAMDAWLESSPFHAVGIYISGKSRACRNQPNLTPTWIRTQLEKGWRLLPITLGPQASCQPRFPRYNDDEKIKPKPGPKGKYGKARKQGRVEATTTVRDAQALGIAEGSTLWYDLEGYDNSNTHCRESALWFLHAWTKRLHKLGYVSGVYSSAGSGILALDNARVNRPGTFTLPDMIWIARWDGKANTSTSYIRSDGWQGARVKQYRGGHNETWGGVTINIDSNYLDVGAGTVEIPADHCGGVRVGFADYERIKPATAKYTPPPGKTKALHCLLQEQGVYRGELNNQVTNKLLKAMNSWQASHGLKVQPSWNRRAWMTLLAAGDQPVVKFGSTGDAVRRVQRALNASGVLDRPVPINGVFEQRTTDGLKAWQRAVKAEASGVAGSETWRKLSRGRR